jgi:hypothetical protein
MNRKPAFQQQATAVATLRSAAVHWASGKGLKVFKIGRHLLFQKIKLDFANSKTILYL